MLAPTPYSPDRWKWNSAIGISASSTAKPVATIPNSARTRRMMKISSRRCSNRRAQPVEWSATIAVTAPKLI